MLTTIKALVEFACESRSTLGIKHLATHTIVLLAVEVANFLLSLGNESHSHALHATSAQSRLYFFPQHWRKFKTYNAVEHSSRLLRVDKILINVAWIFNGSKNSGFGNLMEHNALSVLTLQVKHFAQVPCNSFSLAVLITS